VIFRTVVTFSLSTAVFFSTSRPTCLRTALSAHPCFSASCAVPGSSFLSFPLPLAFHISSQQCCTFPLIVLRQLRLPGGRSSQSGEDRVITFGPRASPETDDLNFPESAVLDSTNDSLDRCSPLGSKFFFDSVPLQAWFSWLFFASTSCGRLLFHTFTPLILRALDFEEQHRGAWPSPPPPPPIPSSLRAPICSLPPDFLLHRR